MHRSYLFAPGHNAKLLAKAFDVGADAVMLDLEDAVPPAVKDRARAMVAQVCAERPAWVRINAVGTATCEADLDAVVGIAAGIRIPKVESAEEVEWVAARAPGTPLICAIETSRGVLAAAEIATVDGVRHLSMGGVDLRRDLNAGDGNLQTLYVRSHLVVVSRAAGLDPPIDSVHPHLGDDAGLREQAVFARSLGFFGKSAIHPRQLPVLHEVFTPTEDELAWARRVLEAFDSSGGEAVQLVDGEFLDPPVAERAQRMLVLADAIAVSGRWASCTAQPGPYAGSRSKRRTAARRHGKEPNSHARGRRDFRAVDPVAVAASSRVRARITP